MKYECNFIVKGGSNLYSALMPDVSSTKRASLKLKRKKDKLYIYIKALDSIALKAFTISVLKLLEVHDKVNKL